MVERGVVSALRTDGGRDGHPTSKAGGRDGHPTNRPAAGDGRAAKAHV